MYLKAQNVVTQLEPPSPSLLNVEDPFVSGSPLEILTSSINQDGSALPALGDEVRELRKCIIESDLEFSSCLLRSDLLSSNGPVNLTLLNEIDPQPCRDGVAHEISLGVWSPTMTVSSIGTEDP